MTYSSILCLITLIFCSYAYAQPSETVRFSLSALPLAATPDPFDDNAASTLPGLYYRHHGDWVPLGDIPVLRRSNTFTTTTTEPLILYRQVATNNAEEPLYNEVARVSLQPSAQPWLILIAPGSTIQTYRLLPIQDGQQDFPYGSIRILNITQENIAAKIGEHTLALPSGSSLVHEFNVSEASMMPFYLAVFDPANEEWKPSWSALIPTYPSERKLMLILPDPLGSQPHQVPLFIQQRRR